MARPPKMRRRPDRDGWWTTKNGVWHGLGTKKTAARKKFMEIHGTDEPPGRDLRVAYVLNQYLSWSKANHSDKTHYRIKLNVESFSQTLPPTMRVRRLLPLHLTTWLDERCPKKPADGSKPISDNTRHDYASDVLGAFNWAMKQRLIPGSPLHGFVKAPKTPRILYLAPEQQEDLLKRIKDQVFRDMVIVAFRTGCRPQELRILEAKMVLPKEGIARIPKELAKGKRKERLLPLDETTLAIIKRLMLQYPEGPLFRNRRGRPWTKDAIKDRFKRLQEKVPYRVTAYSTRHTFINEARRNGVSDGVIAEICGHEDKTMILKVYGHAELQPDLLREGVEKANRRATYCPQLPIEASPSMEAAPA
jgi:integrase